MLTTLFFSLATSLQGGAALHSAEAEIYIELPEIQAFIDSWQTSAIPSIWGDSALDETLDLAGFPNLPLCEVLAQEIAPKSREEVRRILRGVRSVSFSGQVDFETLESVVQEVIVASQVYFGLVGLGQQVEKAFDMEGNPPQSLSSLALPEGSLLDPFGNPYTYRVRGADFQVMCLGADGELGGEGLASDWSDASDFSFYIASQASRITGLQLVVDWSDPVVSAFVARSVNQEVDRLVGEHPAIVVTDLGGDALFPARSFSINPTDMGLEGACKSIEFSLLSDSKRVTLTIGRIKGTDAARRAVIADAGGLDHGSLAKDESFVKSIGRVHRDEGVVLWQGAIRGLGGLPEGEAVSDATGKVGTMLGQLGFENGAWQTRLIDGVYVSDAIRAIPGGPGDLNSVAAFVPDNAVLVSMSKIDLLGVWESLVSMVTFRWNAGEPGTLENLFSKEVKDDIVSNVGRQYALWILPIGGLAPPSVFAVLPVEDGEVVMAALNRLVGKLMGLSDDFRVTTRTYKGVSFTALDVGISLGFRPSFTVLDGMLWVSNSATLLKRTIRQRSKGNMGSRGGHSFVASLVGPDGTLPATTESLFFADVGSVFAAYYEVGRSFAGLIPLEAGFPAGVIDSLPSAEIFTRHIKPNSSWTVFEGGVLTTHNKGSFGPEPLVLSVVAALIASRRGLQEVVSPPAMVPVSSSQDGVFERRLTKQGLSSIELGLLVYSIENGGYPARLSELLEVSKSYPKGYLGRGELPTDAWGRKFIYSCNSKGTFQLYSMGRDGVDQQGAGDDLSGE